MQRVFLTILLAMMMALSLGNIATANTIELDAELSTSSLIKGKSFRGYEMVVSGVASNTHNIVLRVEGPLADYKLWRKEQIYGVWTNHEVMRVSNVPSFYFIATSMPTKNLPKRFDTLKSRIIGAMSRGDDQVEELAQVFYNSKQRQRLYPWVTAQLERRGAHMFRGYILIPETAITGVYTVMVYHMDGDKILEQKQMQFELLRSDLDNDIEITSHTRPLYYAALAILIALTAGAIAGYLFRNDK